MARFLFTFAGGSGHADPLVPIARAARTAGHTVAFEGSRAGANTAETLGFSLLGATADPDQRSSAIAPLRAPDMAHEDQVLRDHYAGAEARRRATLILELIATWRPDLIVCDEIDFGSMIAAERAGRAHVTVSVTATGSFVRAGVVAPPLDELRDQHGLLPDPDLTMLSRHLVVSPFPPSFRDPDRPVLPNTLAIRGGPAAIRCSEVATDRKPYPTERPVVYLTLGTVFNTESGDLFERAIAGLRDLPIEDVVTVGRDLDPDEFGPQPSHVHVERFIAQSEVLPRCDLVVNHGGSGSVIGALAHGLPLVVIPMGADQSLNAARCEKLGVGITLDAVGATSRAIGDAATEVLENGAFRAAALSIREEIERLPGPETVMPFLEHLAVRDESVG